MSDSLAKRRYDERQQIKREQRMARDEEFELNKKKEKLADECIILLLESITAFFQGKARFEISPSQPGIGQNVRFVKDATQ